MVFTDKYTTADLISADKDGIESKKLIVSNDTYLLASLKHTQNKSIENLNQNIEALKVAIKGLGK